MTRLTTRLIQENTMSLLSDRVVRDLHVAATPLQCVRHVLRKMTPETRRSHAQRTARHTVLRDALASHRENQALVTRWRL